MHALVLPICPSVVYQLPPLPMTRQISKHLQDISPWHIYRSGCKVLGVIVSGQDVLQDCYENHNHRTHFSNVSITDCGLLWTRKRARNYIGCINRLHKTFCNHGYTRHGRNWPWADTTVYCIMQTHFKQHMYETDSSIGCSVYLCDATCSEQKMNVTDTMT